MNLQQLKDRLQTFSGFDLTDSQATDLINEARLKFARVSRYPRKTGQIGTTEPEVSTYDWPDDLLIPLSLSIGGGKPWEASDRDTARAYEQGTLDLVIPGCWYMGADETGERKLVLYPTPDAELAIELEWVYRPGALANDEDEPTEIPKEFHAALCWQVGAIYYETVEDNPELGQREGEKAAQAIVELQHLDDEQQVGNGVFLPEIVGWTAPA